MSADKTRLLLIYRLLEKCDDITVLRSVYEKLVIYEPPRKYLKLYEKCVNLCCSKLFI